MGTAQGSALPPGTYLPLVPMQQGRPVMAQSMCGWFVWFPALFLVQIWVTNGDELGQGLPQPWAAHQAWELGQRRAGSRSRKQASLTKRLLNAEPQPGQRSN